MSDAKPAANRPNLEQLKKQARELLRALNAGEPAARARAVAGHPRLLERSTFKLSDALLVLAREHGFDSFPKLKAELEWGTPIVAEGTSLPLLVLEDHVLFPFGTLHLAADTPGVASASNGLALVATRSEPSSARVGSIAQVSRLRGRNDKAVVRLEYRARAEWRSAGHTQARVKALAEVCLSRAETAQLIGGVLRAATPLAARSEWVSLSDLQAFARAGELGPVIAEAARFLDRSLQRALLEARDTRQLVTRLCRGLQSAVLPASPRREPASAAVLDAGLVVLHAAHHPHLVGRCYALSEPHTEIGRGAESGITLLSSAVSRRHARIVHGADGYVLEDQGSTNGSFLNDGHEPVQRSPLRTGDRIKLGDAVLGFIAGADCEAQQRALARHAAEFDAVTRARRLTSWWAESERALSEARATQRAIGLVLLELPELRAIERGEGLLAGEALLSAAAERVRAELPEEAILGRDSEDRLLVTLPGYDAPEVRALAQKLQERVSAAELGKWGHQALTSLSVGVAIPRLAGGVAELVNDAERALAAA